MRALLLITLLGSMAAADPGSDSRTTANAGTSSRAKGQTLETLVKRGRLDSKVVARELVNLQVKAKFTKPLAAASCVLTSDTGDLVFQCNERVCPGACQVQRNEATIRVRNGVWSVTATTAKQLGDTGACGCCL